MAVTSHSEIVEQVPLFTAVTVRDISEEVLAALRPHAQRRGFGKTNAAVLRMALDDAVQRLNGTTQGNDHAGP